MSDRQRARRGPARPVAAVRPFHAYDPRVAPSAIGAFAVTAFLLSGCGADPDALRPYGTEVPAYSITATGVSWTTDARAWRGMNGTRVRFDCPLGASVGAVYGSDPYTDDTPVCGAGVHAGRIDLDGGVVVIEVRAGAASYSASTRHGVSTNGYDAYDGSFTVL